MYEQTSLLSGLKIEHKHEKTHYVVVPDFNETETNELMGKKQKRTTVDFSIYIREIATPKKEEHLVRGTSTRGSQYYHSTFKNH